MDLLCTIDEMMKEPTCIVGMGNYYRSDDAVGLYIADALLSKVTSDNPRIMNVEDILESYVFNIAQSDARNVLIIDAVECDSESGSIVFGKLSEMEELVGSVSTHKLSLSLSGKIFDQYQKSTYLLGIVAGDVDYGIGLSDDVKQSADTIHDVILKSINSSQKGVYQ